MMHYKDVKAYTTEINLTHQSIRCQISQTFTVKFQSPHSAHSPIVTNEGPVVRPS